MKTYRLLNEVLIEWNETSKEDSDNIFLQSENIKKEVCKGMPDIILTAEFKIDEKRSVASSDGLTGHLTYSSCLPSKNYSVNSKFQAGNVKEWIEYIMFPDFKPISKIKFIINSGNPSSLYTRSLDACASFNEVIEDASENNGCVEASYYIHNTPARFIFLYEELIKYCPDGKYRIEYYIKDNIESCPYGLFHRQPWITDVKFPEGPGNFKTFNTGCMEFIDLKSGIKFPEGTKQIKKGAVRYMDYKYLYIPKSCTSIETGAFDICFARIKEPVHITIPKKFQKRLPEILFRFPEYIRKNSNGDIENYLADRNIIIEYI